MAWATGIPDKATYKAFVTTAESRANDQVTSYTRKSLNFIHLFRVFHARLHALFIALIEIVTPHSDIR